MKLFPVFLLLCAMGGVGAFGAKSTELLNPAGGGHRVVFVQRAGQTVTAGETVVLLDATPHIESLEIARKAWESARGVWQQASDALTNWDAQAAARKAELEKEAAAAATALARYKEIDMPTERRNAEQAVLDAGYALEVQKERFAQRDKLLEQGIIRQLEWAGEEVALKRLQAGYDNALAKRKAVVELDTAGQLTRLQNEAAAKQAAVDSFQKSIPGEAAKRKKELENAKARLDASERRLQALESLIKAATLTAPQGGAFYPAEGVSITGTVTGGESLGWIVSGS